MNKIHQAPVTLQCNNGGAVKIKHDVLKSFIGEASILAGEHKLELTCVGPWQICTKVKGLAITAIWKEGPVNKLVESYTLYGTRIMQDVRQGGYELEGRVKLNGKNHRAFTSSILFKVEETGNLINIGVLYVCL